jgi:hypothetical protein
MKIAEPETMPDPVIGWRGYYFFLPDVSVLEPKWIVTHPILYDPYLF